MRHLVLPAALAAFASPVALAAQSAPVPPQETAEESGCTCTCAACLEKHGPAARAAAAEKAAAERVLEVLELGLDEVDALVEAPPIEEEEVVEAVLVDVTEPAPEPLFAAPRERVRIQLPTAAPADAAEPPANRGYLGVALGEGDDGVAISAVMDDSPAETAGLQAGDVIFNVAGTSVLDLDGLRAALEGHAPGEEITIGAMRDGKPVRMRVVLGDRSVLRTSALPEVEAPLAALRGLGYVDSPEPTDAARPAPRSPEPLALPARPARPAAPEAPRAVEPAPVDPLMEAELPRGYEEIVVRRERRPAQGPGADTRALEQRIADLEAELDRLAKRLATVQAELDRRNPR